MKIKSVFSVLCASALCNLYSADAFKSYYDIKDTNHSHGAMLTAEIAFKNCLRKCKTTQLATFGSNNADGMKTIADRKCIDECVKKYKDLPITDDDLAPKEIRTKKDDLIACVEVGPRASNTHYVDANHKSCFTTLTYQERHAYVDILACINTKQKAGESYVVCFDSLKEQQ